MSTHLLVPPVSSGDHAQGRPDAPVTLVEFGDFECPYCGMAYPIVKAVQRRLGDSLRFVFRQFPLTQIHPYAEPAAEAAEAAADKGQFWPMHDLLYPNQQALEPARLLGYGVSLGIDSAWLSSVLASHAFAARVKEDFLSGVRSGVNGTPTFFINGARHDGAWDEPSLLAALESARTHAAGAKRK